MSEARFTTLTTETMTPEQRQAFSDRHQEQLMTFLGPALEAAGKCIDEPRVKAALDRLSGGGEEQAPTPAP